jgi:Xaa-Pro aminopeptidase
MTAAIPRLYPTFSDQEIERRHTGARALMDSAGVDCLLLYGSGASGPINYLTHFLAQRPTWHVYPRNAEPALLLNFVNHVPCAREMTGIDDITCFHPSGSAAVAAKLAERGLASARIGVINAGGWPYAAYHGLMRSMPDVEFVEVGREYNDLRWVRSAEELTWLRESARITDRACEFLEDQVRPGLSEYDLQRIVHDAFLPEGGSLGLAFVASTPMAAPTRGVPWQYMQNRRLEFGDVIITELTAAYWGYSAQIHRPFAVSTPPTDLYRRLFDSALECYEAVRTALVPGATSEDVTAAGRVVERRGFRLLDSLLHGEAGKNPELGSAGSDHHFEPWTFRENQVMVIQPNPVTPDLRAGLQLGSAVVVRSGGAEALHEYRFAFPVCG